MDLNNDAPGGGEGALAPAPVTTPAATDTTPISTRDAARSLVKTRSERSKRPQQHHQHAQPEQHQPDQTAEPAGAFEAAAAEPPPESAAAPDGAVADADPRNPEAPGETQEAEPAEMPPIEPPRSWTKDEKERFKTLPRELQAYLSEREQERDRELRRSQNEAAEKRKELDAERGMVVQARQQYESALPVLLQTLQQQQAGEFGDIRTMADVEKMSREDASRYAQWDAQQKKIAAVQQELRQAQGRQYFDQQQRLAQFVKRESELFAERAPEIADDTQRSKLQSSAVTVLRDLGFKDAELGAMWRGERGVSLHDHRLQLLIRDGIKFRDAQEKARAAEKKSLPAPQRPGVAQSKGAAQDARIQALTQKLTNTGSLRDAAALRAARLRAGR
jgi:hypothetical protein